MATVTTDTQAFVDALNDKFVSTDYVFGAIPGRKFDKVTSICRGNKNSTTVYAFIDRENGNLYKAAGWNAPAKGIRFTGENLLNEAIDKADLYGGFLYYR